MRRVNEALRAVVSEGVRDLQDPRIGFVTVTDVRATADLRTAKVYVSVLGREHKQRAMLEGLESSRAILQQRINRELRLKRTPVLAFEYDPTVERGVRLTRLVDDLSPEDPDAHER